MELTGIIVTSLAVYKYRYKLSFYLADSTCSKHEKCVQNFSLETAREKKNMKYLYVNARKIPKWLLRGRGPD